MVSALRNLDAYSSDEARNPESIARCRRSIKPEVSLVDVDLQPTANSSNENAVQLLAERHQGLARFYHCITSNQNL